MMKTFKVFLCGIMLILTCCVTIKPMNTTVENRKINKYQWLAQNPERPKALIVLVHGLNLKPEKMDDWAQVLMQRGALILRVGLKGHEGSLEDMQEVHAFDWQQDFREAMLKAYKKSLDLDIPIYFLGFSLGALVGIDWLEHTSDEHISFKKMVLIAPALSLPWYSKQAVKFLSFFNKKTILPSRSPKNYRAQSGTSVSAYEALISLKEAVDKAAYKKSNVSTLVIMDKDDELISLEDIKKLINEHRLNNWSTEVVNNKFAHENYGFRHLLVDEESVGADLWGQITSRVFEHFSL